MRDEYEPDYPADDKDHSSGDEYLLQYFHIVLHNKIMRLATTCGFPERDDSCLGIIPAWGPPLPGDRPYQGISRLS